MPPALPFLRLRRVVAMASVTAMTAFADTYHPAAPAPAGTGASNLVVKAAPPKYPYESIEVLRKKAVPGHPLDEALGGRTRNGTEITPRTPECFPAETRDLFWRMDMVPSGKDGQLRPLDFDTDGDGKIDGKERDAIRGRNTWLLWGAGNESFWNWLAQDGYGITDFLVTLDSRRRGDRFVRAGLINQPGYRSNTDPSKRILGLYLDLPVATNHVNSELPEAYRSTGAVLGNPPWDLGAQRPVIPVDHADKQLFEPGDKALFEDTKSRLDAAGDGLDYTIYGYPSGIFGLRLFFNPDFFGPGKGPATARAYWTHQVLETHDRYYTDPKITVDPKLVRPFRVSVSCGFCHIGPHPLNPPADREAPDWANLSSNIGAQYWKPQPAFGNLQTPNSFLFHFLASQQPGTVDTSLVSTDHIVNANTMNAVFNINARLARAEVNPTERQSPANVLAPSIEDPGLPVRHDGQDWRHTPRVLLDGSDSIGAFGALARVYLNIGTFYEQWNLCHNPLIGFRPQIPFSLEVCQKNSVYWMVNDRYRVPYLAAYFTFLNQGGGVPKAASATVPLPPAAGPHTSTQPMKLAAAKEPDGTTPSKAAAALLALDSPEQRKHGRQVWLDHCAVCHSSKQPAGFGLGFEHKSGSASWADQAAPTNARYVLPMDATHWDAYKASPAHRDYKERLHGLVRSTKDLEGDPLTDHHPFWDDNYLSTDIRVPITLVGTSTARAVASNGIEGHVWDNFSSITYKELPAVGAVSYFNPVSGGTDTFIAPGGGRGYFRPATHNSLWATAPYLHNNSLGLYLDDPSVKGRLVQFTDAMRRLLWKDKRASRSLVLSADELRWLDVLQSGGDAGPRIDPAMVVTRPGDLRGGASPSASRDPGFIYRVPQDTSVAFAPAFVRPLVEGVAGPVVTAVVSLWLWVFWVALLASLAWKHRPRYLGVALLLLSVIVAAGIALTGLGGGGSTAGVLLMGAAGLLELSSGQWWIIAVAFAFYGVIFIQARPDCDKTARTLLWLLLLAVAYVVFRWAGPWAGGGVAVVALLIGWKARPTLPGFSRAFFATLAVVIALMGYAANSFINGRTLLTLPVVNVAIGPFPVQVGPIPRGTPVSLLMSMDPESPKLPKAVLSLVLAMAEIKKQGLTGDEAYPLFIRRAGQPLLDASKCPDFVMDRGHLFGESLSDTEKQDLIAFLKTL